jgi:transglutaminase-like putative cysteine protease
MHDPNDLDGLARALHRFWRDSIRYVRDPAGEEFSDSDRVLLCGYGDCDDKARGFVASCRSIGINARTRPCFDGEEFVHVQAEVSLSDGRVGGCFCESCRWILAELIVRDVELGENPPLRSRVLT